MKILIVGGTGTIGNAVVNELSRDHSIIIAGLKNGDVKVDIANPQSIEQMYKSIGKLDAVISTTGQVHFAALTAMTSANYEIGLQNKLMGQVNLVLVGLKYINDAGSFTLTSGILNHDPIRYGSSASMVNGALDAFVKAAAIEMPRNTRINVVSPTMLTESAETYGSYFSGFESVSVARVALAYRKSVDGLQNGQVYPVGYHPACC